MGGDGLDWRGLESEADSFYCLLVGVATEHKQRINPIVLPKHNISLQEVARHQELVKGLVLQAVLGAHQVE